MAILFVCCNHTYCSGNCITFGQYQDENGLITQQSIHIMFSPKSIMFSTFSLMSINSGENNSTVSSFFSHIISSILVYIYSLTKK